MQVVHLLVKGKVQGVFYRASAKEMADSLGITCWVKNTDEGHVEILAKGEDDAIEAYINWCKQGPPRAIVANLVVTKKDHEVMLERFEVLRG